MKIAIVHDWLCTYAGAEKVLEQMIKCFPQADLFSLINFLPAEQQAFLANKPVTTSFLQKMPLMRKYYRYYLPLMPLAIEQLNVSAYDIVISSSHAVAKGVLTGPNQLHICYCHSPMRYAWDLYHQYLTETGLNYGVKGWLVKYFLHKMRLWDYRTANSVDYFIANSQFIAQRIAKIYRRDAQVIYPPVATQEFSYQPVKQDYYLVVARLVPYKKVPLIAQAFSQLPQYQLKIVGSGPEQDKIRAIVTQTPNIEYLGAVTQEQLIGLMQHAKALVVAAEEDFGITQVEAQACGTPVIAYGRGGSCETIYNLYQQQPTGIFFAEQTIEAITLAVSQFENQQLITATNCQKNAQRFTQENFRTALSKLIYDKYSLITTNKPTGTIATPTELL